MAERVAARQPLPSAGSARASRSTGAAGPLPATPATPDAETADGRPAAEVDPVASWQADYPSAALFRERLAELGLDDDGLRALLTEPPGALAARVRRPSWAATAERALAAAPHDPRHVPHPLSWDAGFARILAPFTEIAADRMVRRAMRADRDEVADMPAVRHCFTDQLSARLVLLARRTLVLHLNVARVSGGLAGATPEQRFADFVRRCSARPGLRALLTEYPVLARLLAQTCEQSVEAWGEVLTRLAEDRPSAGRGGARGQGPGPARRCVLRRR